MDSSRTVEFDQRPSRPQVDPVGVKAKLDIGGGERSKRCRIVDSKLVGHGEPVDEPARSTLVGGDQTVQAAPWGTDGGRVVGVGRQAEQGVGEIDRVRLRDHVEEFAVVRVADEPDVIADGQHRAGFDPAAMEECKPSPGEGADKGTVIVMPVGAGVAKLVCGIDRPGVGMDGRMDSERDPTVVALTRLVMEHDPKLAVEVARRDGRPPFQRSRINEVLVCRDATDRTPAGASRAHVGSIGRWAASASSNMSR